METTPLLEVYPRILLSDFLRYFLAAGAAFLVFWVFARRRLQHRFIQKKFPKTKKLWFEFRYSISTVIIFSLNGLGIFWAKQNGYTQIYTDFATYGWGYFIFSFIAILLFHDTYFYWTHRWMHHPKIYKHVHKVHHLSTNPSPWAAYSFHPFEAIIQAFSFNVMVVMMPLHPLTLFLFLTYMITRDVWGHLGFELFPKGFTQNKWLNWHTTTTHHNLHHKKFKYNFGLYFSWWDNWMKTTDPDYHNVYEEVKSRRADDAVH